MNKNEKNRVALADLFELFVVYEIVEVNATGFLKVFYLDNQMHNFMHNMKYYLIF